MFELITFENAVRRSLEILGDGENKKKVKTWKNEVRPVDELCAELMQTIGNQDKAYIVRKDGAVGHTGNAGLTISWLYWPVKS